MLIIAGAGSGKTRTLTARLLKLIESGVPAEQIVAITFTNKAASEMLKRVEYAINPNSGPFIGTFHAFGSRLLREEAAFYNRTRSFTIFDSDDTLSAIRKAIKNINARGEKYKPAVIAGKISKIKSTFEDPYSFLNEGMYAIYEEYEDMLKKNNAFDFDDLIEKTVSLLANKKEIRKKYEEKFSHILVDEYQDTNPAQHELIKLLAGNKKNVNVVGDDAQAIYGWRHADIKNVLDFENTWGTAKVVTLDQNYRSTGNIIGAASALISKNKLQRKKNLWTENKTGEPISVVGTMSPDGEAYWIADKLKKSTEDKAILYRTNAQSRAIEQALITNNIPYKIFGGIRFYDRKEVKDVISALRIAANPKDSISIERLGKIIPKSKLLNIVEKLTKEGGKLSPKEAIEFFLEESEYASRLESKFQNVEERMENLHELIIFSGEFDSLETFLEKVSLLGSTDSPSKISAEKNRHPVSLMTIHMAKGLEFNEVFISGCAEGLIPHQRSLDYRESFEEERRLLYVAMTRAREKLSIFYYGVPSQFLYDIPEKFIKYEHIGGGFDSLPDEETTYIE